MFNIGDRVVYPMHGAGLVESIEERQILGEVRSYYIVRIKHGNMQVMVPVDGAAAVGLRGIVEPKALDLVFSTLGAESTPMDENWNRRNRENMEHLKTGDIKEVAAVVRNLTRVDRVKKLSTGEKKLLINAKRILSSEISFVKLEDEEKITAMIEQAI